MNYFFKIYTKKSTNEDSENKSNKEIVINCNENANNEILEKEIISINNTLNLLLVDEKNKIDKYYDIWDKYKKFTNEYEFIYSSNDNKYKSVINCNKISRSYFKLWEILNEFPLIRENSREIKIANIAEAPGGFIEAICDFIELNTSNVKSSLYGISLLNNNKSVPTWKIRKSNQKKYNIILNANPNNNGDIYIYKNIENYINTVGVSSCELITCDGGFDIDKDYEHQEMLLNKLLLCETYLMIKLQKNKGNSIMKCFDLFNDDSIRIIYILSLFYDSISIVKPLSSRPANSEKYLLCESFNEANLLINKDVIEKLHNYLYGDSKTLNILIPTDIKWSIIKYNIYYTNRQIYHIYNTIDLIEKCKKKNNEEILENIYNINIEKCREWCDKYNI